MLHGKEGTKQLEQGVQELVCEIWLYGCSYKEAVNWTYLVRSLLPEG